MAVFTGLEWDLTSLGCIRVTTRFIFSVRHRDSRVLINQINK